MESYLPHAEARHVERDERTAALDLHGRRLAVDVGHEARTPVAWFKACPLVLTAVIALLLVGSFV